MTRALEDAIAALKALPEAEQDAIASIILDEISDERRWDEAFKRSQSQLARLTARAREDVRACRIQEAGIDEL